MRQGGNDISGSDARLRLEGEDWQLSFQLSWPALELRDLLALREVTELPPLQVLRARRLMENGEPGEWNTWLLAAYRLNETQQRRCRERAVVWLDARTLPAGLAGYCEGLPMTRLVQPRRGRSTLAGWVIALTLLVGAGLLLNAHGQRERRIAEQNLRAAAVITSLNSVTVPREPVEQLHAALFALGLPALVGDRVQARQAQALGAQEAARLLDEALSADLRAELTDLPALQVYLEQQARRVGQKRLVMGTEHCAHAGERVMPLPGNRSFVLRLQPTGAWDGRLRWAGVQRIDPRQLHGCIALRFDR